MANFCIDCEAKKKSNYGKRCQSCASKKTRSNRPKKTIETTCNYCGKSFHVKPSQIKSGRGKSCSVKCKGKYLSSQESKKCELKCKRCGNSFFIIQSLKTKVKYCSRQCHNPPHFSNCLNCDKEFRFSPSSNQVYCSKKCADTSAEKKITSQQNHAHMMADPIKKKNWLAGIKRRSNDPKWQNSPHFQKGKDHPAYKGNNRKTDEAIHKQRYKYVTWRKSVYTRDDFTCQKCGATKNLHAHHIKPWAKYPKFRYNVDNGLTVCRNCHGKIHGTTFHPRTQKCLNCQKKFPVQRNSRKFCSLQCSGKYRKGKRKVEKIKCPICNQMFYPRRKTSRFCSRPCLYKSRSNLYAGRP